MRAGPKMREARLCDRHAQPLAPRFEHKQGEKGLNLMKKVWFFRRLADCAIIQRRYRDQ